MLPGGKGLEPRRLVGLRDDDVARRHRLPMCPLGIERLGDDDHIAAGLAIIERIGLIIGGIAEGIEIAAIGECRREARMGESPPRPRLDESRPCDNPRNGEPGSRIADRGIAEIGF